MSKFPLPPLAKGGKRRSVRGDLWHRLYQAHAFRLRGGPFSLTGLRRADQAKAELSLETHERQQVGSSFCDESCGIRRLLWPRKFLSS